MVDMQVRDYSPSDYSDVKAILEESKLFDAAWDSEERLQRRIEDKPDSIIVATVNSRVVGSVYLVDDILPFIFRLAVKVEYRKQGIGKILVNAAIKKLKAHGYNEIALLADENNEELKEWYSRQGFKQAGVWRGMWKTI